VRLVMYGRVWDECEDAFPTRRSSDLVPGKGRSRNVIGLLDGPRRCLKIVMAHTDTTAPGPGANDNGSGVGVVVALARRLRAIGPDRKSTRLNSSHVKNSYAVFC